MKQIGSSIYENLTPRQRVVASVEAMARDDEKERRRLINTCPKLTYTQNDIRYSETMEKLMGLAMAVQADLRENALCFFIGLRADPENAFEFLQSYSNVRAAWETTISELGIDPETMKKAGPPTSSILELSDDLIPAPRNKEAQKLAVEMRELIVPASF